MTDRVVLAMPKLPDEAVDLLRSEFDVRALTAAHQGVVPGDWAAMVDAIATPGRDPGLGRRLDSQVFDQLPRLRIVSSFSSGLDGIDVEGARARGLTVTNAPDVLVDPVADIALALVIDLLRGTSRGDRFVRAGTWATSDKIEGSALRGKRAGILGLGRIGAALARRLEVCGMQVSYTGRSRQTVPFAYHDSLKALAETVDILAVCCPLTEQTRGLVTAEVLAALGPKGYLVNIARGEVIDEAALIAALQQNRIGGAGLDVYCNEPQVDPRFFALQNVVLLPHLGGATRETRSDMFQAMHGNLRAFFASAEARP